MGEIVRSVFQMGEIVRSVFQRGEVKEEPFLAPPEMVNGSESKSFEDLEAFLPVLASKHKSVSFPPPLNIPFPLVRLF